MSNPNADCPMTIEDEQELANLMLLAAATYSYPLSKTKTTTAASHKTLSLSSEHSSPCAAAPEEPTLAHPEQFSALTETSYRERPNTKDFVQESPVDSDLLSPGGISLDDTVYLRAGEGHEEVFELALCIEDLN